MPAKAPLSRFPPRSSGDVFVDKPDILDDIIEAVPPKSRIPDERSQYSNMSRRSSGSIRTGLESTGNRNNGGSFSIHGMMGPPPKSVISQIEVELTSEQQRLADIDKRKMEHVNSQRANEMKKREDIVKRQVKKSLENQQILRERAYETRMSELEQSRKFLDKLGNNLLLEEQTQRNRLRRQFEDWNKNIHGKIQSIIGRKIDAMDSRELNRQKNEDYSKFIEICNRKPAIFRDIIIEAEYDP